MTFEEHVQQFVKNTVSFCFIDQEIQKVASHFDKNIIWLANNDDACQSREEVIKRLCIVLDKYMFVDMNFEETIAIYKLADSLYQGYFTLAVYDHDENKVKNVSVSIVIEANKSTILMKSIHTAFLDYSQIPLSDLKSMHDHQTLQHMVAEKNHQLKEIHNDMKQLTANIPGGIFQCRYDENLTIIQMSDSFLSMFGYTREEVIHDLHNSFKELIDPRDFPQTKRSVELQMRNGAIKMLEYRAIRKDGSTIWILDKGILNKEDENDMYFYCVLVDITEGKVAQEELRLALEKHQIIVNQTNDVIFEWDIVNDLFNFSNNFEKKFGYPSEKNLNSYRFVNESHLNKEDGKNFEVALNEIKAGAPYAMCDVRIKNKYDQDYWCQARMTTQFDDGGKPISVIGVLIDINGMKLQSELLMKKAQQDSLTKLLNKEASQNHIENTLRDSKESHALMILDIDDFKMVNDTMGHLFGDAFLCEVANILKRIVRDTDVIGRIGGDEFIVLIRHIHSREDAELKAKEIIAALQKLHIDDAMQHVVSCSIGIALYPDNGRTFNDLYRKADVALYEAKNNGKNTYFIDDNEIVDKIGVINSLNRRSLIDQMEHEENHLLVMNSLIEQTFKILYQSVDLHMAIQSILEFVGKYFDVSRAYIFENTEDDLYCYNSFEWCHSGIEPEIHNLQHISYEHDLGGSYIRNFNENDIFYCQNIDNLPKEQYEILEPQGIRSMLQCAVRDNGKFCGYVGFDECFKNRFWTQEQINTLSFIAEILGIFLLKERGKIKLSNTAAGLQSVLDNQNAWIYVIEPNTYDLLYINKKTKELVPDVKQGISCFKAFFQRDKACDYCPLKALKNGRSNSSLEIFNPFLNVWTLADAAVILWKGKTAFLLTCHDVTEYREKLIRENISNIQSL